MAAVIAHVTGTALTPGVSRNGRYYSREAIGRAVERAKARIADGKRPISMRTFHAANDDSTHVIGRVTHMWQDADTGAAKYRSAIADTAHGRTIAALTDDSDGQPQFLRGVSIRGAWMDEPRTETVDGREVTTADDLEIQGLDFTAEPGVDDADVSHEKPPTPPGESAAVPFQITESAPEALVSLPAVPATRVIGEKGPELVLPEPVESSVAEKGAAALQSGKPATPQTRAKVYADPGYQDDKMKRYALDSKSEALAAWRYIHQDKNASNYTANQLKRIKQRIAKALKGFGVKVDPTEHYLILPAERIAESTDLAECVGWGGDEGGRYYISMTNGPTTVTISSDVIDPADLDLVGRAAMDGACKALATLDPDMDGDVDLPGADAEDTDRGMSDGDEDLDDEPTANIPGTACPCGCGCAIPATVTGCPCQCGDCPVCGSTTDGESAPAPEDVAAAESAAADTPADEPPVPAEVPAPPQDAVTAPITESEDLVTETTTAVEPAAPVAPPAPDAGIGVLSEKFDRLTDAISGLVSRMAPPVAESAPAPAPAPVAAPVADATPAAPVAESDEARIARLVAEQVAASNRALLQTLAESGMVAGRRGLAGPATTPGAPLAEAAVNAHGLPAGWPDKPLHQFTTEELNRYGGPVVFEHAVGHYAPRR